MVATMWAVIGVVAVGVYMLHASRSYTYDESVSIDRFISPGSPRVALTEQFVFNNHPTFSAVQSVVWWLGGDTESWQRLLPVLYGVATAVLVGWALGRRLGVLAGAAATAVVLVHPMFAEQARLVRGYSLAALAVVVAGIALVRRLEGGSRRWLAVHGLAATIAVTTHLYATIAFVAFAVFVAVLWLVDRRRIDVGLLSTWVIAAAVTLLVYLPTLDDLRETAASRGNTYRSEFAADALTETLGAHVVAVVALGLLCVAGLVALASRARQSSSAESGGAGLDPRALAMAAVAAGAAMLVMCALLWLVVQPRDLYPRFLVVIVPGVAVAVAVAVARSPRLIAVTIVAVVAMTTVSAERWADESPIRRTSEVLATAEADGLTPCAVGSAGLGAYIHVADVRTPADLDRCDVFAEVGSWATPDVRAAVRRTFDFRWRVPGAHRVWARVPPPQAAGGRNN